VPWRALPNKCQLLILASCRLSSPLSSASLLAYVFYLVKSITTPSAEATMAQEIARTSGLLVAVYPLGQCATSLLWGRLSDMYGRKSMLVIGLSGSILSNICFGFSRSLGTLIFWRIIAGMANGNVGVMRTMTAEIVKERRFQTRAFLLMPLLFKSSMVLALALGGCLADPVVNLPGLFGPNGLVNFYGSPNGVEWAIRYPYALPVLFNAVILGISLAFTVFGLRETLPSLKNDLTSRPHPAFSLTKLMSRCLGREVHEYTLVGPEQTTASCAETKPLQGRVPFSTIWTRDVVANLISFALLPLHNAAFMHIFPVYLSMQPSSSDSTPSAFSFTGGLGLTSPLIGLWLSGIGICGILLQLFLYPRLQARIGTRGCFRLALAVFPLAYCLAPYLSLLAHHSVLRWPAIAVVLLAQVWARTIAIPSSVILLHDSAPSKTVLGTVHGAGNMMANLARAIGTVVGGYLLALGVEKNAIGIVWWCYLAVVAVLSLL
ncbi:MFS general substrate transporter, partial [Lophium mytilinum]